MLFIHKRFTLGINPNNYNVVKEKLDELEICPIKTTGYRTEVFGRLVEKMFMEFDEPIDKFDKLSEYLQNEFKGVASITY